MCVTVCVTVCVNMEKPQKAQKAEKPQQNPETIMVHAQKPLSGPVWLVAPVFTGLVLYIVFALSYYALIKAILSLHKRGRAAC